jgi:excisionase family DNA binding protein
MSSAVLQMLEELFASAKQASPPAAPPTPPVEYMTVAEFAARIGTSEGTVREFCKEGMPHLRPRPRLTRIHVAQAEEWLRARAATVYVAEAARLGRAAARRGAGKGR